MHSRDDDQRLTYRFATAADIVRFYGEPQRQTTRAVIVLLDDEPVGIVGIAHEGRAAKLFSESKPELQPHMRRFPVLRAIKQAMRIVRECGRQVYAVREEGTDTLERLGFVPVTEEVYLWPG